MSIRLRKAQPCQEFRRADLTVTILVQIIYQTRHLSLVQSHTKLHKCFPKRLTSQVSRVVCIATEEVHKLLLLTEVHLVSTPQNPVTYTACYSVETLLRSFHVRRAWIKQLYELIQPNRATLVSVDVLKYLLQLTL